MALLLACSLIGVLPTAAVAEPAAGSQEAVDAAQATLDEAEARMGEINAEYEALTAQVADLQAQIDESSAAALEAQQAMLEGRALLGEVAVGEYRDGSSANLLMMIIDSKSFDDLLRNMEYVTQIMDFQAEEVARQKERKQAFDEASAALNAKKNEQEAALAAQDQKRAEAQAIVDEASGQLDAAKADHAARLAQLAAQAEAMRQAEAAANDGANAEGANTVDRQEVVGDDAPVQPNPQPVEPEPDQDDDAGNVDDKPSSDFGSDNGGGWLSGTASAYGGSTDPYTPNPGTTATGAVCDDNSMGVAVPMSMPNYRSYFGRTVEISWNGKTVYATVNDCGSMRGGSRVLDLQPGVWKAFGFSSCRAWGLRTVSYRFL